MPDFSQITKELHLKRSSSYRRQQLLLEARAASIC